jgi:hypothetical protein
MYGEVLQTEWQRNLGSIPGTGKKFFSSPDLLWGQPIRLSHWHGVVKQLGREADHEAANAEVKNGGTIPPLSHTSSERGA